MTQDNTREALAETFATDPSWLAKIDDGRIAMFFTIEQFLAIRAALSSQPPAPTDAARDVLAERARQISAEGWTPEHDEEHEDGQMATAAACYALIASGTYAVDSLWPWAPEWLKPKDRRRNLIRAGALILAEIERIDRASAPSTEGAAG